MRTRYGRVMGAAAVVVVIGVSVFGAAGTDTLAWKGKKTSVSEGWPQGAGDLVNDRARTEGWKNWFSGMCDSPSNFAFEIENTEDLNRLLEKLAAMQCETKELWLDRRSDVREYRSGPDPRKGNQPAVVLQIGDQLELDHYLKNRTGREEDLWIILGDKEVDHLKVGPPRMLIHIQNPAVNLEKLHIPEGVTLKNQPSQSGTVLKGDAAEIEAQKQIDAFLKSRAEGK